MGLFSLKTGRAAGRILGKLWFALDSRHRKVACDNLKMVYGDKLSDQDALVLAKEVFCNIAAIPFEIGWSIGMTQEKIEKYFSIHGKWRLDRALAKGHGCLVLTAHFGNWEMIPAAMHEFGYDSGAVYRPFDFRPMDRFFKVYRGGFGVELYAKKKKAVVDVIRNLSRNGVVAILLDQNTTRKAGVFVDFLGHPACTNKGLALLAGFSGAAVLPIFCIRTQKGFRIEIGREIPWWPQHDREKELVVNTRNYNRAIEAMVLRYPCQWFWVHRRWKTRPVHEQEREPTS